MLALISLLGVWAGTAWHPANLDLINISSSADNVEDFFLVAIICTGYSLSVNEKHALAANSLEPFQI
jgi:hypothetical protein